MEDGFTLFAAEAISGSALVFFNRGYETRKVYWATIAIRYRYKIVDLFEPFEMSIRCSEVQSNEFCAQNPRIHLCGCSSYCSIQCIGDFSIYWRSSVIDRNIFKMTIECLEIVLSY
ncbi:hypothetical protein A3748_13715 [Erythrobacter sp. HI0077]|nr:hypothetical protein A3745_11170 [Erythrobacter sp. HI0074]KZZ07758.1 hypothetical protein A3748_13715 [Erythrobacter sp. HI0077]